LNNRNFEYELDAPDYELEFGERKGYIIYGENSAGIADSKGGYTVNREFSKPVLFLLIIFSFIFIIITICWLAFLTYTKKFYDRLYKQKLEELTAKYKVEPYTIEDVFLVYSDGTLINHQTRRLKTLDDDIFMGMLTSIKDFIKDAMSRDVKGELNELTYGRLKILIEHGAYVFLAVVVSGKPPPELRKSMKVAVRRIHKTHLVELRDWDGNIGKMEPAKKIVTEMLLKGPRMTGKTSKFDKRSANAWNDRGVVYTKIGNFKEALTCFDRAIRINPSLSEVWSNKGIALYKMHKYERAMNSFDKALILNPYNKKAKRRREKCWYKMQLRDVKKGKRAAEMPAVPSSQTAGYPSQGLTSAHGARPQQRRVATSTPSVQTQGYGIGATTSGVQAQPQRSAPVYKEGTEPCPDCGRPMRYTHEYKDWWCDYCNRYPYEEDDDSDYSCEYCGQPLEYIDEYQKWYCDYCKKYA
jgi:tetratricopeptide (TPR) repeat protein